MEESFKLAIEHNQFGERCHYVQNLAEDLGIFEDDSVDLVCSLLVLQHIISRCRSLHKKQYI